MTLRDLMIEAGIGNDAIEFVEQGLRDEDLVVVPTSMAYLRIRLPWRKRGANRKSEEEIGKVDLR